MSTPKTRPSRQAKGRTHVSPSPHAKRAPRLSGHTAAAVNEGAERGPKLPVPVAVIAEVLRTAPTDPIATNVHHGNTLLHSAPAAGITVEVETRQGYVYTGRLIDIDAHYNLQLQEATVRRERTCDVERELIRQEQTLLFASLGPQASRELAPAAERPEAPTRPRRIGSLMLRSSNLVLIRFLDVTTTRPASREEGGEPGTSVQPDTSTLLHAFRAMAVTAKRAVQDRRRKAREERRRRVAAAKAAKKS